ncbi:translocator protein, LysE family [Bacteriovorax sp. BAL6_X]|uniref:LysE family translocator n=1 Tax=Bacteriovorax sp. BAL6_X TaxID=1201290 RepID=UPI0003858CC0|nr:LysE family transporter [Bacteriovorax sp. BAL6_X]EPZ51990.1 translocator protein, LysE family [Bacteriovorax sp. BAL6_X]
MVTKILTSFVFIIAPLCYSPGPANVTLAGLGGTYSFKKTLPFILGLWFSTISGLLICLYGATDFIMKHEKIMAYLPIFGALYLFYMAYKSLRSVKKVKVNTEEENSKGPSFLEGVIFQALNPKFLVFTISVYSPFLNEGKLFLTLFSAVLFFGGASAHLLWFFMGNRLAHILGGKKAQFFFSFLLVAVGLWMISTTF